MKKGSHWLPFFYFWTMAYKNLQQCISDLQKNGEYFGLKVNGLSMIEKGIFDGDIAIIKKTNSALNGKIAAVLTKDNEITLKTINIKNNKIFLIPANKNYKEQVMDLGEVQIQGTLSGIIRKYN